MQNGLLGGTPAGKKLDVRWLLRDQIPIEKRDDLWTLQLLYKPAADCKWARNTAARSLRGLDRETHSACGKRTNISAVCYENIISNPYSLSKKTRSDVVAYTLGRQKI